MSQQSPVLRSQSRTSSYSTTTYHSFQDIDLYEPASTPEAKAVSPSATPRPTGPNTAVARYRSPRTDGSDKSSHSVRMVRRDSGYESSTPIRNPRPSSRHHCNSSNTKPPNSPSRMEAELCNLTAQKRPSLGCPRPISHIPRSGPAIARSPPQSQLRRRQQQVAAQHSEAYSYFHFPYPENLDQQRQECQSIDLAPAVLSVNTANANANANADYQQPEASIPPSQAQEQARPSDHPVSPESPVISLPPQTTHYWTSDRTRRLEYAAIDATSRGVRGWVMHNCMPECFVPQEKRRVGFEDDGGSVRRYRLDLEIECPEDSLPPGSVAEKPRHFGASAMRRGLWAKLRRIKA